MTPNQQRTPEATSMVQPMPCPETWTEFERIKPDMIDTLGRPLVSELCPRCQVAHFTVEPCASELPCPTCGSTAARCSRPSGHEADSWHSERISAFDALRDTLAASGVPQVAPWAAKITAPNTNRTGEQRG